MNKILIANRGEIAIRIMRVCRELGIASVSVYFEADKEALFAEYADEAYLIGPPPPTQSYLNIRKIIEVAKECGGRSTNTLSSELKPIFHSIKRLWKIRAL